MMLLLALLLAQAQPQEKVVVVARPQEKPGFFQKLARGAKSAFERLYTKEDPDIAAGNELNAQGDPENALKAYDRAKKRLGDDPRLQYDRANTLLKLGAESAPEAASEAGAAFEHGDKDLKPRAAFDMALADEAMGLTDEAIKAYEKTLQLDPDDEDAKVNLELLLKTEERKKQQQSQQQEQQKKQQNPQDQKDKQQQQSKNGQDKEQQQKQPQDQGKDKQEQQKQAQQNPEGQPKAEPQEKKQQQAEADKPVDRSEAERLLDALRAGEKNLQTWRFAKDKRKNLARGESEKDW
jgi:Ca-activated chloride channel family protein